MGTCNGFYLIFLIFTEICNYGLTKSVVKRFEHCDPNVDYDGLFNTTFKIVNNKQYVDGSLTLKKIVDNTIRTNVTVDMLVGNNFIYMFTITERKACDAVNKYFGEFIYDMERQAGLIPGMCPIPKGRHEVHNYLIDLSKMVTRDSFPFGHLRFTLVSQDRKNNIFTCFVLEVVKHI